jgi:hypothetical protein
LHHGGRVLGVLVGHQEAHECAIAVAQCRQGVREHARGQRGVEAAYDLAQQDALVLSGPKPCRQRLQVFRQVLSQLGF